MEAGLGLRMSRVEITRYLPLAVCMALTIHIVFSLFAGWHDYCNGDATPTITSVGGIDLR